MDAQGAELRIANRLAETEKAREWVERFCSEHGLPQAARSALLVSLDEVLTNIVSYAYADSGEHEIRVSLALAGQILTVEIEDDGVAFDPTQAPSAERAVSLARREVGGLGIEFLRSLNDEVSYRREGGRNRLVLKKKVTETS